MPVRSILVTGANGGLGQAIAREFLRESPGNSVWLGVRRHRAQAEALSKEYSARCHCLPLDVTSPENWREAVRSIAASEGSLQVLVNNAGHHQDGLLAQLPAVAWDEVIASNLTGAFHGCQAVLPHMIAQRHGRIINISSLSALLAPMGQTNYAAAKAGLLALTQSLAKEVARIGITVNAVCPGYVDTDAVQSMSSEERASAQSRIPMRRFGKPEEIATAVRFLACAEASYITGSVLKVDGGIL